MSSVSVQLSHRLPLFLSTTKFHPHRVPGPLETLNGIRGDTWRGLWSSPATVMADIPLSTAV